MSLIHRKTGKPIYLFNQVRTDLPVCRRIAEMAGCDVFVDFEDRGPHEMRTIIANANFMVASRFHSCIFALLEGVPVLAISYNYKTEGIMDMLEMSDCVRDISSVSARSRAW